MHNEDSELLKAIKQKKREMHITDTDLSEILQIDRSWINNRLHQPAENWNLGFLIRVCKVLKLSVPKVIALAEKEIFNGDD